MQLERVDQPKDSGVSMSGFFARCKLPPTTRDECDNFVKARFPSEHSRPVPIQGYCSYTVIVGLDSIVQFRPPDHKLDVDVITTARHIFGDMVPKTKSLGGIKDCQLRVYFMRKLEGSSLFDLRALKSPGISGPIRYQVVRDFARLQAASWQYRKPGDHVVPKKLVGSSLQWRIDNIRSKVPSRFRTLAHAVHQSLPDIEKLPWVMSHGDFISTNILISPDSGKIVGLLDWAEAEWLPFGVSMYGLEELLGEVDNGCFKYYPDYRELRAMFWKELLSMIPELLDDAKLSEIVQQAQILGLLLWHAIAFDNGRLERVVEDGIDDGEIQRLDAFLMSQSRPMKIWKGRTLREKWRFPWDIVCKIMDKLRDKQTPG